MTGRKIIVVAASSDIGAHLAERWLARGADVVGTFRKRTERVAELERRGATMLALDIAAGDEVRAFAGRLKEREFSWDTLVSAPGLLEPIGPFFATDFDAWEDSVATNSTAQLRVLHALYPARDPSRTAKVLFFAGGGTNGAFDNYSAYCIGKMALLKMVELLDSECPDLQASIIGTGWVNTKIHLQTLAAGDAAGPNLGKTRQFVDGPASAGTSLERVAECVDWCLSAPRSAVGGRNFSVVHDAWEDPAFIDSLRADKDAYKLRRRS